VRESARLNIAAIEGALYNHALNCVNPADEIILAPFEAERLQEAGVEEVRGVPITADATMPTGRIRVICGGDEGEPALWEGAEAGTGQEIAPDTSSARKAPTKPGQREAT
jgi:hypothetical protein